MDDFIWFHGWGFEDATWGMQSTRLENASRKWWTSERPQALAMAQWWSIMTYHSTKWRVETSCPANSLKSEQNIKKKNNITKHRWNIVAHVGILLHIIGIYLNILRISLPISPVCWKIQKFGLEYLRILSTARPSKGGTYRHWEAPLQEVIGAVHVSGSVSGKKWCYHIKLPFDTQMLHVWNI